MRMILLIALAIPAWCGKAAAEQDPRLIFHIKTPPALICEDAGALRTLSQPNAKQALGDINYTNIITQGRCAEIGNNRPLIIGPSGPKISGAWQYFKEYDGTSRLFYINNNDLVGYDGRPPHDIPPH